MTDDLKPMPIRIWVNKYMQAFETPSLNTMYIRADTIPAPEKIDGVQEALDWINFERSFLDVCHTYECPFWRKGKKFGPCNCNAEHFSLQKHAVKETIKRALILAGAKE